MPSPSPIVKLLWRVFALVCSWLSILNDSFMATWPYWQYWDKKRAPGQSRSFKTWVAQEKKFITQGVISLS
jgi:hypothetical protein